MINVIQLLAIVYQKEIFGGTVSKTFMKPCDVFYKRAGQLSRPRGDFAQYCGENKMVTRCILPRTSYSLQHLEMSYYLIFQPIKKLGTTE